MIETVERELLGVLAFVNVDRCSIMQGVVVLLIQGIVYFLAMGLLLQARGTIGVGVFVCVLGVMHCLETYLAAVFFIELPFGLISPGSTVLFSGKIAILLLLYIEEDAEAVRQPIYGLLIGNTLLACLGLALRFFAHVAPLPGYMPDLSLVNELGLLMIWGTALLFVDCIMMIIVYEKLGEVMSRSLWLRFLISLVVVLTFDQVFFYAGLHMLTAAPAAALVGGWIAKMGAALVYATLVRLYIVFVERGSGRVEPQSIGDTFSRLTYRRRYEDLLSSSARDPLTGALNRREFDRHMVKGLRNSSEDPRPLSVAMIDVDHFKSINDRFGHARGDEALKVVATLLAAAIRTDDRLFRYGGEEFVVVFADIMHAAALDHAERLRNAVESGTPSRLGLNVTVSIGIATFPGHGSSMAELVERADANLYRAKRSGRNRVIGDGASSPARS